MAYCPYADMNNSIEDRQVQADSYIRIMNASPNSPGLDIYLNNKLVISNLVYKQVTKYVPLMPGEYNFKVYPTGQKNKPVLDTSLIIVPEFIINAAIIGMYPNISLYPIPEPANGQNYGRPCIRVVNLSPDSPKVDVTLSNGSKVFTNIGYKDIAVYACMPAGTYTFQISPTGTKDVVLTLPNVTLEPNKYYTIYITGTNSGEQPLEASIYLEPRK